MNPTLILDTPPAPVVRSKNRFYLEIFHSYFYFFVLEKYSYPNGAEHYGELGVVVTP